MIPSALQFFNKQTVEKKENLRNFIGFKQYKDPSAGLYGVDFCVDAPSVDRSNYVPCLEKGCSFRGPVAMMELHNRTIHEMGFDKEINIDNEAWIKNRKKNFPTMEKIKEKKENIKMESKPAVTINKFSEAKNRKRMSNTKSEFSNQNSSFQEDPLSQLLSKKMKEEPNKDILGLGASYGSSDEDGEVVEDTIYLGLPLSEELGAKQLQRRKNKFRFPILAQMELAAKRQAMMNPQRRYLANQSRKTKRPRLGQMLCADQLSTERDMVLQCVRYLCNKRFYDAELAKVCVSVSAVRPMTEAAPEEEDMFKMEEAVSDDELEEGEVWSDCDL